MHPRKFLIFLLISRLVTPLHASEDQTKILASLADCPAAVQASVKKNGHDTELVQIKRTTKDGIVRYALETGSEEGKDRESTYFYAEDGTLKKTEQEIPLNEAPEAVRDALKKLAGNRLTVDDVEKVTEGSTISYKAELESNGGKDRKVRISASGDVLENVEEKND